MKLYIFFLVPVLLLASLIYANNDDAIKQRREEDKKRYGVSSIIRHRNGRRVDTPERRTRNMMFMY